MKKYLVIYNELYLKNSNKWKISNKVVNLKYNPFTELGVMKLTEELKVSFEHGSLYSCNYPAIINIIKIDE